jgi:hypothetical protein
MAGLRPAIHVFLTGGLKTWLPGTRPGMNNSGGGYPTTSIATSLLSYAAFKDRLGIEWLVVSILGVSILHSRK